MSATDGAKQRRRRFAADDRGMTAVEFAFLTPVLFIVLMVTVQFAVYLFAKQAAQSAARAGDRLARAEAASMGCMQPNATWQGDAQAAVASRATGISGKLLTFTMGGITASAAPDNTVQAACAATVTVTFDADVPELFLPGLPRHVHVTASGPVEQFVRHP